MIDIRCGKTRVTLRTINNTVHVRVYWNQCVREHISKDRRLARERDFCASLSIISRAFSFPFCASCQSPRPSVSSSRAVRQVQALYYLHRGPRSRTSPHTCLARPFCNPCQLVPPPRPVRPPPPARSRRGIDIYEVRWLVVSLYYTIFDRC